MTSKQPDQRASYFENARFFRHVPQRTLDSLSTEQRRDIAFTIMELQRSNPRVLQEIYLDNPYVMNERGSPIFRRIKRRLFLMIRTFWFSLPFYRQENRASNRVADILFMVILSTLMTAGVIGLLAVIYYVKRSMGIDLFDDVHLFCS